MEPHALARSSTAFALPGGIEPTIADDLEEAVREADIVSCATLVGHPLIRGAWLKKGAHVDLVGAFTPRMREADNPPSAAPVSSSTRATARPRARVTSPSVEAKGDAPEGYPGRSV